MAPRSKTLVVASKTVKDFSSLKLLLAFFVPYTGLTYLFARGLTSTDGDPVATLPLGAQEQLLTSAFGQLSFTWAAGFPAMVLVAVLAANGIARDEQTGTVRILLSKPVSRRQVLLGKYIGVVTFGFLATVACLLVGAVALYATAGASPSALGGSIFTLLPGTLVFAFGAVLFVAAVGTAASVFTASRLKTALIASLVPALFFAFLLVRLLTGGTGTYEQFKLYYLDVNYHLGNFFVTLHGVLGPEFSPITQSDLGLFTGVYDHSGWGPDPLVGGFTGTVPVVGHVSATLSILLGLVLTVALLVAAVLHFDRKDIS